MKKSVLLAIFGFCTAASSAQTFEKAYLNVPNTIPLGGLGSVPPTHHNIGTFVQATADGGFLMFGNQVDPETTESSILLVKTDSLGNSEWKKYFGGSGNDFCRAAASTADGGFVITGGTRTIVGGEASTDIQLIRIDADGNELWTKTFGGAGEEEGASVKQTADGGFIIAGKTTSYGTGAEDVYLAKTDANGTQEWSKTFGGIHSDAANVVIQAADGGYFIAGETNSFGAGSTDIYMIRTDAAGDKVWAKTTGGAGTDRAASVVETSEGEFVIAGSTGSFGDMDVYLIKISGTGSAIWAKTFGGINNDKAAAVCQTSDGGFLVTGETESFGAGNTDMYLIKTTSGGNSSWTKTYGDVGTDAAFCSVQLANGGYITTGSLTYEGGSEGFSLIRSDENGNTTCSEHNTATIIASVTLQIIEASATAVTSAVMQSAAYTSMFEENAMLTINVRCSSELLPELAISDSTITYVDTAMNAGFFNARTIAAEPEINLSVYPNPSAGQFYFSGLEAGFTIEIYNASAELVAKQVVSDAVEKVDLTGQTKGFYFYRVRGLSGQMRQAKILIQ